MIDLRSYHLGLAGVCLREKNDDLPLLEIPGESRYGSSGFSLIVVHGVYDNTARRRALRAPAIELLKSSVMMSS